MVKKYIVNLLLILYLTSCTSANDKREMYALKRKMMVETQIKARGIKDKRVIDAMLKVERHKFVPEQYRDEAYNDYPLPIGKGQTISQPYIVALMTELLKLKGNEKVLEIGTGSGYQAAILSLLAKEVYTIDIICELAETARKRLKKLGYKNVKVFCGDGYKGLKEYAPFDAIIVTCAPPYVPPPLIKQLKVGGRMVIPVGEDYQELKLIIKTKEGILEKSIIPVRFVPMLGDNVKKRIIKLPFPNYEGRISVERAIYNRRSIREFKDKPVTLKELSQLLWAAGGATVDGVTGPTRSYPSAGGLYPLDIYVVIKNVLSINPGIYKYEYDGHYLILFKEGDYSKELAKGAWGQDFIAEASFNIVYFGDFYKEGWRYGKRGAMRYISMDVGHSAQNVVLQAESLGLGTVPVGAFNDEKIKKIFGIKDKDPLYIIPVGRKK